MMICTITLLQRSPIFVHHRIIDSTHKEETRFIHLLYFAHHACPESLIQFLKPLDLSAQTPSPFVRRLQVQTDDPEIPQPEGSLVFLFSLLPEDPFRHYEANPYRDRQKHWLGGCCLTGQHMIRPTRLTISQ